LMDYKQEEKKGCLRKYHFNIQWSEIGKDYEETLEKISKEAELPGFRKGKAPLELVKAKYKNPIEGELKSRLLHKAASEIVENEKLQLFSDPGADALSFVEKEGFSGSLYFEVFPEVPDINYEGLEVEIKKHEVTEEDIKGYAEYYRAKHAEIKTMDDVTVLEGDYCSASISPSEGDAVENIFVMCSEKSFDPIEKFLVGKKCGETFELEIGENQKKPKGKYRVSVTNVVRRVLPQLDKELAVKCGFSSLDELMSKSKENAQIEMEQREKEDRNKAIVKALLEKYKFAIPFSLLDRQLKNDAEGLVNELARQGRNIQEFDWEKYFEIRKIAVENNIRAYFIISRIIEQEGIKIIDEDLQSFLKTIAEKEGIAVEKVREILEKNRQIEEIKFKLAEEKALENISKYVKIKYSQETPEKDKGGNDADSNSR